MWLILVAQLTLGGYSIEGRSDNNVLLTNHTGLIVARVIVGERTFETSNFTLKGDLLVHVSPGKHHLHIVFRGGAESDWPAFNFKGVHEIIFQRTKNKIFAHYD